MRKIFWMVAILAVIGVFVNNSANAQRYGHGYGRGGGYRIHGFRGGYYAPRPQVIINGGYGYAQGGYSYGGGYAPGYQSYGYDPYYSAPPRIRVVVPVPRILIPRPRFYGGGFRGGRSYRR